MARKIQKIQRIQTVEEIEEIREIKSSKETEIWKEISRIESKVEDKLFSIERQEISISNDEILSEPCPLSIKVICPTEEQFDKTFFDIFSLSPSHWGIFIAALPDSEEQQESHNSKNSKDSTILAAKKILETLPLAYLKGELNTLKAENKPFLWEPSRLLSKLSMLTERIISNSLNPIRAWYGVIDLNRLIITFSNAGFENLIHCNILSEIQNETKNKTKRKESSKKKVGQMLGDRSRKDKEHKYNNYSFQLLPLAKNEIFFYSSSSGNNLQSSEKSKKTVTSLEMIKKELSVLQDSKDWFALHCDIPSGNEFKINCNESLEAKTSEIARSIKLATNKNLEIEFQNDIKRLLECAAEQVIKGMKISQEDPPRGFCLKYWLPANTNKYNKSCVFMSVRLDKNSVPWSYSSYNSENMELDFGKELILRFDLIKSDCTGMEISAIKNF